MRRHSTALLDVQCHCRGGMDGGGGIRRQIPAAASQLGPSTPQLPHHHSNGSDRTRQRCRGGGKGPPAPQRRCHLSTHGPSTQPIPLLLSDSGNQTQSRRQGDNERGGGRGAACAATRLTPPVNAWAIGSQTRQRRRGDDKHVGGGEGPPAPQRRCHLLMRGPSTPPLPLLLSNGGD